MRLRGKIRGRCFWGGIDTPMHTMIGSERHNSEMTLFIHQLFERYIEYVYNDNNWKNVVLNVASR